jgi:hypothetical protein
MPVIRPVGRFVGTVLFTLVETATLGVWLALVTGAPTLSRVAAVGAAVLVVGLVVEAVVNTVVVNGIGGLPLGSITVFSVTEALVWIVWLAVAERVGGLTGVGVAGVVVFVLMLPQHAIEDNVLRGRAFLADLVSRGVVGFTFVEAAGATVWLAFVFRGETLLARAGVEPGSLPAGVSALPVEVGAAIGLGLLAVALLIEHVMGVQFALREGEPGWSV